MGSMLWGVDNLLNDMIRPMFNAYQFKDYETAANILQQLNDFLCGMGAGIKDLPRFERAEYDVHDRINPAGYYKDYYETYARSVIKAMGMYIRTVLASIQSKSQYFPTEDELVVNP